MQNNIIIINGPNINLLGDREKSLYGNQSYEDLLKNCKLEADKKKINIDFFQSNSEGEITEYRWYCPSIRGNVAEWNEDIILGVPAYLELISFTPGETSSTQIELEFDPLFESNNVTLNSPIIFNLITP